jgi:hypothetical protein
MRFLRPLLGVAGMGPQRNVHICKRLNVDSTSRYEMATKLKRSPKTNG